MEEISENRAKATATALLRALQPAIPAVIGAAMPCWSARMRSSALGAPPNMAREMSTLAGGA